MVKCLLEFSEFPLFCRDVLKELHYSKHFADVTLVGDDDVPVKAHKIILCAHSNVLEEAILSIKCDKIVLQCRGFKSHDITSLLDFMYLGETASEYRSASILFKLGKFLQIRHLGEECDLSLEELCKKFEIEAIEVIREQIVKDENIETGEENIDDVVETTNSTPAKIVYKNNPLVKECDPLCNPDESLSWIENKGRHIDAKNFNIDREEFLEGSKRNKNTNTKRNEATIVKLYNSVMDSFNKVEPTKEWKPLDETEEDDLNTNLCKFFKCLVKPDGTSYNRGSLTTYFHSMKRYLLATRNIHLDKEGRFRDVFETVNAPRRDYGEENGEGARMNSCSAFREEDIQTCFRVGTMGQGNPTALLTLVIYNLMVDFGCKTIIEVYGLLNRDLIYGPLNASSEPEYIQFSEHSLNKHKKEKGEKRIYLDSGLLHGNCPVRNILFYQKMKTPNQLEPEQPFLWNPVKTDKWEKMGTLWYENLRLGINSIGKVFKNALIQAGVDLSGQNITGLSAVKTRLKLKKSP